MCRGGEDNTKQSLTESHLGGGSGGQAVLSPLSQPERLPSAARPPLTGRGSSWHHVRCELPPQFLDLFWDNGLWKGYRRLSLRPDNEAPATARGARGCS